MLKSGRFLSIDRVQAAVLKECPESDKMVVTVAQCLFSTAQCLVVAVVAERDFSKWKLRLDVGSLAVLYSASSVFFSKHNTDADGHKQPRKRTHSN